ncbi:MAG: thiol reductant ABC exporter subunit CydD [Pseudomonadota bacterium]
MDDTSLPVAAGSDRHPPKARDLNTGNGTQISDAGDGAEATNQPPQMDPPSAASLKAKQDAQTAYLKGWVKPFKPRIYLSVLLGLAAGLCLIGQAALLAHLLFHTVVENTPINSLLWTLGAMAVLILIRGGLMGLAERVGVATAVALKTQIRETLWRRFADAGPDFIAATGSGPILTGLYDQIEALDNYIARYLPQRMLAGLIPLAIFCAVLPVNWLAALALLVTGPVIILMMALVGLGAADASRKQMLALERLGGYFVDRLRGLETLRLFGQAEAERQRVEIISHGFRQRTMSVLRLAFLSSAVLEFFSAIAIAVLAVNIGLALLGLFTLGPLGDITLYAALFILILAPDFYLPLRQLGQYYHDRATALAAADSLMALERQAASYNPRADSDGNGDGDTDQVTKSHPATAREPRIDTAAIGPNTPESVQALIDFRGVDLTYDGDRPALKGISLTIQPGEKLAIVGPSGSGKTSLLKLLLGFAIPTSGMITIDDQPLGDQISRAQLRDQIAWIGQRPHLFRGTIASNIALAAPQAGRAAIEQAAEKAGVSSFANSLPQGLDTPLGDNAAGVSGGEAQRIAIARAILADRPILIMDEPTANLDRETADRLIASLQDLIPGRTVIMTTHSPAMLRLADRVIGLRDGQVIKEHALNTLIDEAGR